MSSYIKFIPFYPETENVYLKTNEYPGPLTRYELITNRIREKDQLEKNDPEIIKQTSDLKKLLRFNKFYRKLQQELENEQYEKEEIQRSRSKSFSTKRKSRKYKLKYKSKKKNKKSKNKIKK
jgi:hypothetical protein